MKNLSVESLMDLFEIETKEAERKSLFVISGGFGKRVVLADGYADAYKIARILSNNGPVSVVCMGTEAREAA